MDHANLCLHRGAREVARDELSAIPVPAPSRRWYPIAHVAVLETVEDALTGFGLVIQRSRLAVSSETARFFGVLDLTVPIARSVTLSVGIRNSTDQSFPLGFCAGHRVFVCDNLAFSAELMVRRKHTRFGHTRFRDDIVDCVSRLEQFKLAEQLRIERMQQTGVSDTEAESLMLRALESRLISHRLIFKLIEAWREPAFEEFAPRTRWSLYNAFTLVLAERALTNPQAHARSTMCLQALLGPRGGDEPGLMDLPASAGPTNETS